MNILVTGGLGFIGKNLIDALKNENNEISIIDIKKENNEDFGENVKIYNKDIRDREFLNEISKESFDQVYHLAAKISVPESFEKPYEYYSTNVLGSINVFDIFRKSEILYVSSAAVYGDLEEVPIIEEKEGEPSSVYGFTKKIGELSAEMYKNLFDSNITTIRPFNVYGPGQKHSQYAGVIIKFLKQWQEGKNLTIRGDGNQTRDFVHVKDVCKAMVNMIGKNKTFNVGSGGAIKIINLARMISENIEKVPDLEGEIKNSFADISKASEHWKPEIKFDEGLEELKKMWKP